MEECRCRRPAGKAKCHTGRVRQEVLDDRRVEAGHRDLREKSGVGEGATATGRTHGRAGKDARRGTQSDLLHDAGIEARGRLEVSPSPRLPSTPRLRRDKTARQAEVRSETSGKNDE